MPPDSLLPILETWAGRGWIRPLDLAFARFLHQQAPEAPAPVLLAATLASHQLGRGQVCLDLAPALADPEPLLQLPPEGEMDEPLPPLPAALLTGLSLDQWEGQLARSPLVTRADGSAPLVLDAGRLYLRRYWRYSRQVTENLRLRLATALPVADRLSGRLDSLFAGLRSEAESARKEIHWQSVAAAMAARSSFSVISGGPGTGKTTTVVRLLALFQGMALDRGGKLRMRLAAPTGKAAARLTESISQAVGTLPQALHPHIPTDAVTLHRLLGSRPDTRHLVHHRRNPLHLDLLVVDEASMIDLEMMAALLDALPTSARLVLLGDKDQLASVEAGAVLGELCAGTGAPGYRPETIEWVRAGTGYDLSAFAGPGSPLDQQIVVLRKSHRFGDTSGIGTLAREVRQGCPARVRTAWGHGFGDIHRTAINHAGSQAFSSLVIEGDPDAFAVAGPAGRPVGYGAYLHIVAQGPPSPEGEDDWFRAALNAFGRFQLLCALRKGDWGVEGLNRAVARHLYRAGLIPSERGWYPGRPVIVTRNDYSLGLMNGDIGITLPVSDPGFEMPALKVVFPTPDHRFKKVLPSRLSDAETVYAMTVHKSQGSEFDHTALVLPDTFSPVLTRELIYTAITRARSWFTLAGPKPGLLEEAASRSAYRASGLSEMLRQSLQ
jgi:exodeoxyribonuclease V alpha subunit